MTRLAVFISVFIFLFGCRPNAPEKDSNKRAVENNTPFLIVLGTLQDGGSPHAGCSKTCCSELYNNPDAERKIISLGLVDPSSDKTWLFEASPDLPTQLFDLNQAAGHEKVTAPDGIFLTHAHIGHYAGLMYIGKEAMNTKETKVYVMPRFKKYLETNGPWSQLVLLRNIELDSLKDETPVRLGSSVSVTPFLVPHRDEYSETVGFIIQGPTKKILFIPDIDKWSKWEKNIIEEIRNVDIAFLDATFYDGEEINNRDISQIPHPFVVESIELFKDIGQEEKEKIYFIHFNHTNPLLLKESQKTASIKSAGFNVATRGIRIPL